MKNHEEYCRGWYSDSDDEQEYEDENENRFMEDVEGVKMDDSPNLIVSQDEEFKLDDNVSGQVVRYKSHSEDGEGKAVKMEEVQITIKSAVLSMDRLRKVIMTYVGSDRPNPERVRQKTNRTERSAEIGHIYQTRSAVLAEHRFAELSLAMTS